VSVKNMWGRPATSPRTALSLASKLLLYDSFSFYPVQCAVLPLSDYLRYLFRWSLRRRVPQIFLPAPRSPLCRPLFKYRQNSVYLVVEKYHKANSPPNIRQTLIYLAINAEMYAKKKVVEGWPRNRGLRRRT